MGAARVNVTSVNVLQWFPSDPVSGLLFFMLGFFGALVTVYFYVGEFLPLMGGPSRIKELQSDIAALKSRISEMRQTWDNELKAVGKIMEQYDAQGVNASVVEKKIDGQKTKVNEIRSRLSKLEDDLIKKEETVYSERRSMLTTGFIIYLILGGFFSTLLATDVLQAVVIGAGWTTFASTLGLKREEAQKSERRKEEGAEIEGSKDKLEEILSEQERVAKDLKTKLEDAEKKAQEAEKKAQEEYSKGVSEGIKKTAEIYGKKP